MPRRVGRPGGRSFSDRAQSLRLAPKPFAPLEHHLLQCGSNLESGEQIFDASEPLDSLPPWLDEFGSNVALFPLIRSPTAVEGSSATPDGVER